MPGHLSRRWCVACGTATLILTFPAASVAQAGDTWQAIDPLPTPRRLLAAAEEGGRVYTFGGCGSPCFGPPAHSSTFEETLVEVLDPATGHWSGGRAPIPAIFFGGAAAAPGNGRIYLLGGFLTGDRVLEYTPATDSWRSRAPMPSARHGLAAVAIGGEVYAVGGSDGTAASGALEIYDPATDSWRSGAPMPTRRVFLAAAEVGGRLYAVGGSPDCCGNAVTAALEVYDPATGRWTSGAPLPMALQVSAAASDGERLFVFGGFLPGQGTRRETFEYDPATDSWSERAPLPVGRDQAPAVAVEGCAFVLGGSVDCHCQALDAAHKYTFDEPPSPPDGEEVELAVTLTNGVPTVASGDTVTYTLTVTKNGDGPATARVRDDLPERFVGAAWTCAATGGAACPSPASGAGSIDREVSFPPGSGAAATFTITGTIAAATECPIPLTVTARATVEPLDGALGDDSTNNSALDRDRVAVVVDLDIDQAGPPSTGSGDEIAFFLTVTNDGPDIACGATVVTTITPPGALVGAQVEDRATFESVVDVPVDDTVEIEIPGTVSPTILATCPYTPAIVSEAEVMPPPGVEDTGPASSVRTPVPLVPEPAPEVTKTDGRDAVACGDEVSYRVAVENLSDDALCGATVSDPFSDGLAGVSWTCAPEGGATCGALRGAGAIGDRVEIPGGEGGDRVVYTATGTVTACAEDGFLMNVARVDGFEGADATDVDTCTCPQIQVDADLSIEKTIAPAVATAGGAVVVTLEVTNDGPGEAVGAVVQDLFPPGLAGGSWTCAPAAFCRETSGGPGDLLALVDLPPLRTATFTVQAVVAAEALCDLVNAATVVPPAGVTDPRPDDNHDTATLTVFPAGPGVRACKTVAGACTEGSLVTYAVTLLNPGPFAQADNPGDELTDLLPPELMLLGAQADSGVVATAGNQVTWNGGVPVGGRVTITIDARILENTEGEAVCNQAMLAVDPDGDGVNDAVVASDDPSLPGFEDPTCFDVCDVFAIPALSPPSLLLLAGLLAGLGALRLRAG